jgi:hypothetical protein
MELDFTELEKSLSSQKEQDPEKENKELKDNKDNNKNIETNDEQDKKAPEDKKESKEVEKEVEYALNDKGDLVDDKGNVLYKKGDFDVDENGEVTIKEKNTSTIVEMFKDEIEFVDEDGNPLEFKGDPESEKQAIDYVVRNKFNDAYLKLVEQIPIIDKLVRAAATGKNINQVLTEYVAKPKWGSVDFKELNEEQYKAVSYDYFTRIAGVDETTAKEAIQMYEDTGKLKDKAESFLNIIKEKEKEKDAADAAIAAKEEKERRDRAKAQVAAITNIINNGKLDAVVIPKSDRNGFLDFVVSVEKDGYTKAAKTYAGLPDEKKLLIDYLIYKGVDFKKVIENTAETIRIKKETQGNSGNPASTTIKIKKTNFSGFNANDIDFDKIQ